MPILEVPSPNLTFNGPGITQVIAPNTRNGSDNDSGFMFILHDATIANLTPVARRKKKRKRRRGRAQTANLFQLPDFDLSSLGITTANVSDLQVNTGATTPVFLNESESLLPLLSRS